MIKPLLPPFLMLFFILCPLAGSDGIPGNLFGGYESYLGYNVDSVFQDLGAPDDMSVYQGEDDAFGSVVFHYTDSVTLFWIDNRVWQLRLDKDFLVSKVPSLAEITRATLLKDWETPYHQEKDLLVYNLADAEFPVGCAFYFNETGTLMDLYLFRRDY